MHTYIYIILIQMPGSICKINLGVVKLWLGRTWLTQEHFKQTEGLYTIPIHCRIDKVLCKRLYMRIYE